MIKIFSLITFFACNAFGAAQASGAADPTGKLKANMPFLKARALIIQSDWNPVEVHLNDGYEFIGVEKMLRRQRIPEIESCAMDAGICIFNYKKEAQCLRIQTRGETLSTMRVESWSRDCP